MEVENQKQVWNSIAPEWHEFKSENPAEHTKQFLKKCKGKILDLGSGSGRHLFRKSGLKMYLVDFSEKMIELAKQKAKKKRISAEFFVANMEKLPFENNFFDYAICISALHCLNKNQQKKAVKELYRVMKKSGQAEIGVWNKNSKRFKNAGKEKIVKWRDKGARYYYLFTPEEVYKLFEKSKFKIIKKEPSERINSMIIFVVKK